MQVLHRISVEREAGDLQSLRENEIQLIRADDAFITFEIDEAHPFWLRATAMLRRPGTVDIIRTAFTPKELASAALLEMAPSWHHGYPQPEDDYAKRTYDPATYCAACGLAVRQLVPFRMAREPKWGNRQILQLNWVFDEYFVKADTWELLFKPLGINPLPVINHKTGRPLDTVVQLEITARATPINAADLPAEVCAVCNRVKFMPLTRGPFPHVELPARVHIAKTREYFGSGSSGWQAVLVSQSLYRQVREHKLKGVEFTVVAEPGQLLV
jgi:hypothetical protein